MGERILLLNLTRLGDMLQSQPLLEDLHDSGHRISLLCLENFASVAGLMRHVDECCALPGAKLLADTQGRWQGAVARLLNLTAEIREQTQPSKIVNLTPTLPARLLSRLLAPSSGSVIGFDIDIEGFGVNRGVWASFLSGASARRANVPFNIVDMFRRIGAELCSSETSRRAGVFVLEKPSGAACFAADALLGQKEKNNKATAISLRGYVGFQLGASEARRQWPVEYFTELGKRLWEKAGLCPVLMGTEAERSLALAYAARAEAPFVNAVGQTDIPELAALLIRMRLLVTNDTGTMHLAAGLGIPCLALFLATAQPWDTGPYLTDCCCMEPALPCHPCAYNGACRHEQACLTRISAQSVGDVILGRLESGSWDTFGQGVREQARVWLTGTDRYGFASLRCLSGHEVEDRSRWLEQQRLIWRQILDDLDGREPASSKIEHTPSAISPVFSDDVTHVLTSAAQMLVLLTEQGRLTGRSPLAGQLFLRNCERLQQLLDSCKPLVSLSHFWRELVQDRGGNMEEILRLTNLLAGHLGRWAQARCE